MKKQKLTPAQQKRRNFDVWRKQNPDKFQLSQLVYYEKRTQDMQLSEDDRRLAARKVVNKAKQLGHLTKPDKCEMCGYSPPLIRGIRYGLHGHHQNPAFPYEVTWVCTSCHMKLDKHRNNKRDMAGILEGMERDNGRIKPKIFKSDYPHVWNMYYNKGWSQSRIAALFHVSIACVSRILTRMRNEQTDLRKD